jgi:hypothetical protein
VVAYSKSAAQEVFGGGQDEAKTQMVDREDGKNVSGNYYKARDHGQGCAQQPEPEFAREAGLIVAFFEGQKFTLGMGNEKFSEFCSRRQALSIRNGEVCYYRPNVDLDGEFPERSGATSPGDTQSG